MKRINITPFYIHCLVLYSLFSCQENKQPISTNPAKYKNSVCELHEVIGPVHTLQMHWSNATFKKPEPILYTQMQVFNQQGFLIDIMHRGANNQWYSINSYDSVRRVLTEHSTNADGIVLSTVEYYYDALGNELCRKSYHSAVATKVPNYMECNRYNDHNNLIETDYYHSGQSVTNKKNYEYNEAQQQVKSIDYENNMRDKEYSTYVYDNAGNMIEENTYSNGKLHHVNKYTYDAHGNAIEEQSIYTDRDITRTTKKTYEYDKYGNWLVQKGINDDQSTFISKRIITYY